MLKSCELLVYMYIDCLELLLLLRDRMYCIVIIPLSICTCIFTFYMYMVLSCIQVMKIIQAEVSNNFMYDFVFVSVNFSEVVPENTKSSSIRNNPNTPDKDCVCRWFFHFLLQWFLKVAMMYRIPLFIQLKDRNLRIWILWPVLYANSYCEIPNKWLHVDIASVQRA